MFWLKRAIHAVPSACSRWPPVGSGALRSKTPMLSRPRKAALEHVLAEAVLAVHPPGEVQQELVEGRLEEIEVRLAAQGLLGAMQEQRSPRRGPAGSRR
jgi:hypothetical protein